MQNGFQRNRTFSDEKVRELRSVLSDKTPQGCTVITCGSYARREASANSDIDFYFVSSDRTDKDADHSALTWGAVAKKAIDTVSGIAPSKDGAFATVESSESLVTNIGGENDTNKRITRRVLMLLEGEWLANESEFRELRHSLLKTYIKDSITDHQLALFLLNDIVRYYRTIAVDYEFKTVQAEPPKPWAIRNIKLIFSRKLLYMSGVFSVAMTADLRQEKKISVLEELFDLPVIERLQHKCGPMQMQPVRDSYDRFLDAMEDPHTREHLKALPLENRGTDDMFRDLKNEGHHFSRELMKLYENTFDTTHPIRRSLIL